MATQVAVDDAKRVTEWIRSEASALNTRVTVSENAVRDGDWLHVPVSIDEDLDAYGRASRLQQIEDAWDPQLFDGINLLLVPAKISEPSKDDFYAKIGDLMRRQDTLLEKIEHDGMNASTVDRLRSMRQEWHNALDEMGKAYHQSGLP